MSDRALDEQDMIHRAAELIRSADALLVTTGAGMGVASGMGTFRGANAGIWPPLKELGIDFTEMSNPVWFSKPEVEHTQQSANFAWSFWHFRHQAYTKIEPHAGYSILKRWGESMPHGMFSFTSNIDGHWGLTIPESSVYEIHGSIRYIQCALAGRSHTTSCYEEVWETGDVIDQLEIDSSTKCAKNPLPRCKFCGKLARPNVLMFGDPHYLDTRQALQDAMYLEWKDKQKARKDRNVLVIEIGAGTAVPSVRMESEYVAQQLDATVIRINPEESSVSGCRGKHKAKHLAVATWDSLGFLRSVDDELKASGWMSKDGVPPVNSF